MASRPPSRDLLALPMRIDAEPMTPGSAASPASNSRTCSLSRGPASRPQSREAPLPGSRPASRPSTREGPAGRLVRAKAPVQGAGGHHSSLGSEAAAAAAAAAGQHAGAGRPGAARGPPGLPPLPPARNPEESLRLLGQGKGAADEKAAELKFRLAEMTAMMDENDKKKADMEDLRADRPAALERLNAAWMQADDPDCLRDVMDEEADAQGAARYEDQYNVMSRCKYKYNPFFEMQRYLPAIGTRALLAYRGTAVEVLGDPSDVYMKDQWQRRMRKQAANSTCGPMERPKHASVDGFGRYVHGIRTSDILKTRVYVPGGQFLHLKRQDGNKNLPDGVDATDTEPPAVNE